MRMTYTTRTKIWGKKPVNKLALGCLTGALAFVLAGPGVAGDREKAKRIHDRLTGVPPTATILDSMESVMGNPVDAALMAIDPAQNPNAKYFYNVTLKNFATPWTNEAQSVFAPLNDYSATVIGMVRDNVAFNELLSADILYVGGPTVTTVAPYSPGNNQHYADLEDQDVDLSDEDNLVRVAQSSMNGLPSSATAGVITTRAASEAFFVAGTNRAMFRFTMLNHLCNDMEQVKDTSRAPDRVRQDVSRSPGGDSRLYLNGCVGCHNGMDPLTQAYAYYDYDETAGRLVYTPGQVQPKYLINADNFKYGYVTPDDHWDNYWRSGPNAMLGWDTSLPGSGDGAKSMGQELANSDAFARCQVTKVFRNVCLGEPDQTQLDALVTSFQAGYNLKQVFAETVVQCLGD